MEQSGNIPIFNIPGTLFGNIPRNFIGNFYRIFWEYIMRMFHEYSTNIYLPGGYDSHLIMKELGKSNFKISVTQIGLEKYMSFNISNKLSFINSFQFLGSSLNSLNKSLDEDDFKYFSQEFYRDVLDLVKQKGFFFEYISGFEKFKKNWAAKKSFKSR